MLRGEDRVGGARDGRVERGVRCGDGRRSRLRGNVCAHLTGHLASKLGVNVGGNRRVLSAIGCGVCFAQLLGDG
ncbi:hypothetical protein PBS_23530 [Paraburkholderia sp. 2C]